jgi:hypothetical protein
MTGERPNFTSRVAAMRNFIKAAPIALALVLVAPVAAQDFVAGMEAYERDDYVAAF